MWRRAVGLVVQVHLVKGTRGKVLAGNEGPLDDGWLQAGLRRNDVGMTQTER